MKISARNVFEGRVTGLLPGPVNTEVSLALGGGAALVAVVTADSARELGLAIGGRAWAIVKAPWVFVTTGGAGARRLAVNEWQGSVSALKRGSINAEVAVTLPGGAVVHAVLTQEAVSELGLAPGVPATVMVKPSQVVLAV